MIEFYRAPDDILWHAPSVQRSEAQAQRDGLPTTTPPAAGWLSTIAAASGGRVHQWAACRHYVASLDVQQVMADLRSRRRVVVLDAAADGAEFFVGPGA